MLYAVGVLASAVHLIAYDPFDDPQCRLTCVPVSLAWATEPSVTHLATVATAVVLIVLSLVATVVLATAATTVGWAGWGTVSAVYGAAALAEIALAVAAGSTLVSWDTQAQPSLFVGRAITTLVFGATMLASGVQARRATRAVRRLGEGLDRPDKLAASIGRALHDPELSVAYWYPDVRRWVDSAGSPVAQPEPGRSVTTVARRRGGGAAGARVQQTASR